jgi:hypothetical protein
LPFRREERLERLTRSRHALAVIVAIVVLLPTGWQKSSSDSLVVRDIEVGFREF